MIKVPGPDADRTSDAAPAAGAEGEKDVRQPAAAEEELREAQILLAGVLESSIDGVMVYRALRDETGRILDFECRLANPASERITGRPRQALVGSRLLEVFPGTRETGLFGLWSRVVETGTPLVHEHYYGHEGIAAWFDSVAVRVEDGFAVTFSDVTERRRLEEDLRHSQKMEAIGRLAGGIAHDFNNLLTAINGYAEMVLARVPEGDPTRSDLIEIRSAGERAASLTRQLLAFSRRQVLQLEIVRVVDLVKELESLLRRLIGEDIVFETALAPDTGGVRGDRSQLQQVLMNLAVNARDAMPGGGRLRIETDAVSVEEGAEGELPAGRYVRLRVQDTGQGMDEATLSRIFEPFFTTKDRGRGTGLGLSTVYGIVHQSGGRVTASSRPDGGATFTVLLPRVDVDAGDARAAASAAAAPRARAGETVLLVEDEEVIRRLVRRVLRAAGYGVIEAADGAEGLAIAERHRGEIDVLLSDVVMPVMGGPELAHRLRQSRPAIRVLFISGYDESGMLQAERRSEDVAFLEKPFGSDELQRALRAVLDAPGPRPGPRT